MSNPIEADNTPITSLRQLAEVIASGCKQPAEFRIGTEHEKFGFHRASLAPPAYRDSQGAGIEAMLQGLNATGDAKPILDRGNLIGLTQTLLPGGKAAISLEPAGQLELSGAPLRTLHETAAELDLHLKQVRAVAEPLGLGFAPLGFHPTATRDQMPWMPKRRYAIMRRYMPQVGSLGLDMMTRTCTVQVNLDYSSEADMRRKLFAALALQPLATALFANSPFKEGRESGLLSTRAQVWTDTDNRRSGIPALMMAPDFGFERYVRYLVDEVPMYFVTRNGEYYDTAGASFRGFMDGKFRPVPGITPLAGDFRDHMTTVFTDVRLKQFLEMRGADAGTPAMMVAQSALWVGLLYDDAALHAAFNLVRHFTHPDVLELRAQAPARGLDAATAATGRLRDLLPDVLAIARQGLAARAARDAEGRDETIYLAPLEAIAAGGPVQAEHWLARFRGPWQSDCSKIWTEADI
jgi:glutamate--cysteine ligase